MRGKINARLLPVLAINSNRELWRRRVSLIGFYEYLKAI